MAAPSGNQFWKLRSKHGRDILFATPELLWDACVEYFEATDARKWTKKDWVGKDAVEVDRETDTPYTITGLCLYLNCNRGYFSDFKKTCSQDFSVIVSRVEDIIFTQQFEGASVGVYNGNIIARNLGLIEKSEISATVNKETDFSNLSNTELEQLAISLEKINAH